MTSSMSSDPPSKSTTLGWFRRDLEAKADKSWVEAKLQVLSQELSAVKEKGDDTKNVALRAKEQAGTPHHCQQKDTLDRLCILVDGWSRWWRSILVSFIGIIVSLGVSGVYQYISLSNSVKESEESYIELQNKLNEIELSQRSLKDSFSEYTQEEALKNKVFSSEVYLAISKVAEEARKRTK